MLKKAIKKFANIAGYKIEKIIPGGDSPFPDGDLSVIDIKMEKVFNGIYEKCRLYTMTSIERMYALYKVVQYIVKNHIPGDIVECGVWKGGSSMLCALTLVGMRDTQKNIYMYDTYSGMTKPTEKDIDCFCAAGYERPSALERWETNQREDINAWAFSPLDEVKNNMFSTKFPKEKIVFAKGKVEDTIPSIIPEKIALLRLDTDWYDSTYHELTHLFPKLSIGGVIIIDDYGHWLGAKEAVDRYLKENSIKILLNRIDYTGRIGVKYHI